MRPDPTLRHFAGSEATLAYFDWPGDPGAPVVMLVHATGFHGRVWDQVVYALPPGWRVLAVELRGHGRSSKEGPFDRWEHFARDLVELADYLQPEVGPGGLIPAGHSMGGWAVCYAALARPAAFRHLVLIDPTMNAPEFYGTDRFPGMQGPADHPSSRRRSEWRDWQAFFDRLHDRDPYSRWQPAVLEDYCRHGLLPAPDGKRMVLACPPLVEANVYFNSWRAYLHDRLIGIEAPVTLLRAFRRALPPKGQTDYAGSPTWERLAEKFRQAEDHYLPEYSHFIPMENPALVASYVARAAGG